MDRISIATFGELSAIAHKVSTETAMNPPSKMEHPKINPDQSPIAHLHIFLVLRSIIASEAFVVPNRPLRLLDIGCGDGRLIDSLLSLLNVHVPNLHVEIYGFDIGEQGYQDNSQKNEAISFLKARHPGIQWKDRIKIISGEQQWDYAQGFFDVAVSNQVIEHVRDLSRFLDNLRHSVNSSGFSIHLFPLGHCIQEAHCHVPFAHWITDFNYQVAWIALLSRLGVGRYRKHRAILGHRTISIHAQETAKYIQCWTTYRTFSQIAKLCHEKNLSISYHYTKDFFFTKLRRIFGMRPASRYNKWTLLGIEWLTFMVGRSLSSSTLVIRPIDYDIGVRIAAEKAEAKRAGRVAI